MLKGAINRLKNGEHLGFDESYLIMKEILNGEDLELISHFLIALREKGETEKELLGFIQAIREEAKSIEKRTIGIHTSYSRGSQVNRIFSESSRYSGNGRRWCKYSEHLYCLGPFSCKLRHSYCQTRESRPIFKVWISGRVGGIGS